MREIVSPISGIRSPFGQLTSPLAIYAVLGKRPELVLDFENERYFAGSSRSTFSDAITHTRASTATYVDSNGVLQTASVNEPRVGHHVWNGSAWVNEGLLHESEARTNSLPNSVLAGATAGVIGSGGALPSGGSVLVAAGMDTEVIGSGTSNGFPYVDVRVFGTPTSAAYQLTFNISSDVAASSGQTWTGSFYAELVGGDTTNVVAGRVRVVELASGAFVVATEQDFTIGDKVRAFVSRTMTDATTTGSQLRFRLEVSTGNPVDITLRFFVPQLEQGATPSSPILTTGSAATRAADVLTIPAANLPWPEPVVIGPELVTNGGFDTDVTGWTEGSGATLSSVGGQLQVLTTAPDSISYAGQAITVQVGKVYEVTATKVSQDANSAWGIGTTVASSRDVVDFGSVNTGTLSAIFVAPAATVYLQLWSSSDTVSDGVTIYDNISVREINPLAVSIQMDGRTSFTDTGSFSSVLFFNWFKESNNQLYSRINDGSTRVSNVEAVQFSNGVLDLSSSNIDLMTPGVLAPFDLALRAGSNFINIAFNGTSYTENATVTALPDLSETFLILGPTRYMGTIRTFRVWANDITDAGLVEATEPSLEPSLSLIFDGTENSFTVEDWTE